MKSILISITIIILLISCKNLKVLNDNSFKTIIIDTFAYEQIQQATKILNYSSLTNGVDSFEIRLWTSLGTTNFHLVESIKYEDSNWHFSQTQYWYSGDSSYPNRGSKIFLDSGDIEFSKLQIPFSTLVRSLDSFKLKEFPTQSQIHGLPDNVADGFYDDLEISTKNYYKHFFYHEPGHYSDNFNRKFISILKLLSTEPK